jgi:lysozyme
MTHRWDIDWAARFVAPFEGEILHAYQDSGGVWTIGYGHTKGVMAGDQCTHAQALAWLAQDLREAARAVNQYVTRKLSVRQRIAWISFAFNCGSGALAESTALARFNAGDSKGAAAALLWWSKDASGNTLEGLLRRRKAEGWLLTHKTARALNEQRKGRKHKTHTKAHKTGSRG